MILFLVLRIFDSKNPNPVVVWATGMIDLDLFLISKDDILGKKIQFYFLIQQPLKYLKISLN